MKKRARIEVGGTVPHKKALSVEDLKKHFLSSKWAEVMDVVTAKTHLLTYLGLLKRAMRAIFADKPIFLQTRDGILVIAVRASGLDFEARCRKTETLIQKFQAIVPDDVTRHIGVSVI